VRPGEAQQLRCGSLVMPGEMLFLRYDSLVKPGGLWQQRLSLARLDAV
jgi:hypothetical protein